MVRILSCHHFRGQRIGRCDEALGVAVAGDAVIVALEHQVNIYGRTDHEINLGSGASSPAHPVDPGHGTTGIPGFGYNNGSATHDIGTPFTYRRTQLSGSSTLVGHKTTGRPRTTSGSSSVDSVDSDTELRLSHSFSTIDPIDQILYSEKGKYILCLERRETSNNSTTTSVRVYFHWEKNHDAKPMRARIAGLVSPTGAEPEDDSLMMVEIPLTSPATAVASCNLTGHIACLSAESIINLFLFRAKEATGRNKVHYFDFDRVHAIEMPSFVPEKIYFLTDYIACMNSQRVHVFRMKKEDHIDDQGHTSFEKTGRATAPSLPAFFSDYKMGYSPKTSKNQSKGNSDFDKVVFDPRNETVKVHLNSILRSNRKRRSPSALISEEFPGEIVTNLTKVVFTAVHPGISVEDVLRVTTSNQGATNTGSQSSVNNQRFVQLGMYPIRIKDNLGGIALIVATPKEGCLYHLPNKQESSVTRVTTYPLTAPLVSFTFDSLFFHALTETGLESYTCRSLYHTVRDMEGLKTLKNDCPFYNEAPSLVGIRPFLRVRHLACNDRSLCILACSTNPNQHASTGKSASTSSNEENLWTVYFLELPDIDMIYEDVMRTAQSQVESNRESYFTLLCEAHILLRLYMNAHPDTEFAFAHRYRETCKLIGLEYLKSSWINPLSSIASGGSGSLSAADAPVTPSSNLPSISSSPPSEFSFSSAYSSLNISEDIVDKGVTYLIMGRCDLQEIFSLENSAWLREPRYIPGFVRLIETTFSEHSNDGNMENHRISPTLAPILVEFLANNGPQILVDLVIRVPFLRECNSRRLIHILQQLAESREYHSKETLALLLTLVTVGSVDQPTRNQVKEILHKTKISDLGSIIQREAILEKRGKQTYLSDLAVCFAASDSPQLLINTVVLSVRRNQILISEVMLAFAQAVNLNADTHLQHCITKCLTSILETCLSEKLSAIMRVEKENDNSHSVYSPTFQAAGVASGKLPNLTDEEKRAVQTLVRTYLSNFNVGYTQNTHVTSHNQPNINSPEHLRNEPHHAQNTAHGGNTNSSSPNKTAGGHPHNQNQVINNEVHNGKSSVATEGVHRAGSENAPKHLDALQRNQIFGKVPSFVNFLLSLNTSGGTLTPQSQNLATTTLFPNEESRESFIKLLSLLTSILANIDEVKDLVLTYLYKNTSQMKPSLNSPLHVILQILSEPTDKSVNILLSKQPTTVMLYAKEMFGRAPLKWKVLVAHLKKKVQANPDTVDSDMYATILEGVYLHLANTLTPAELEQVLDKETEESSKFHGICKRVELANTYANMIITVSSDYLGQK